MNTDRSVIMAVVLFLGGGMLLGLGGLIWLVGRTEIRDAALLAIIAGPTGTALGALGTLLASTGTRPAEVQVINRPNDPVPVEGPDDVDVADRLAGHVPEES